MKNNSEKKIIIMKAELEAVNEEFNKINTELQEERIQINNSLIH